MIFITRLISGIKCISYSVLAIMLILNIMGPEGIANLLEVNNPSVEGKEIVGVLIPTYVLYWTLGTVFLEVISNLVGMLEPKKGWKN